MADLLLHATFVFAVLGTKLVLALWAIYYLFPDTRACPACDAETLAVAMPPAQRLLGLLLFLGQVRRRWCPECGWDGFVRAPAARLPAPTPLPARDPADRTT